MGFQIGWQPNNTAKNKENTRAATASEAKDSNTWIHVDKTDTHGGDTEMDRAEEFTELTDEVFDELLQQCEREKTHTMFPKKIQNLASL